MNVITVKFVETSSKIEDAVIIVKAAMDGSLVGYTNVRYLAGETCLVAVGGHRVIVRGSHYLLRSAILVA